MAVKSARAPWRPAERALSGYYASSAVPRFIIVSLRRAAKLKTESCRGWVVTVFFFRYDSERTCMSTYGRFLIYSKVRCIIDKGLVLWAFSARACFFLPGFFFFFFTFWFGFCRTFFPPIVFPEIAG